MQIDLELLKSFNWKRHGNTVLKVLMDFKVLALIGLNGVVVYGMWDTFFHPSLDGMKSRDSAIEEQRKALTEKENLQKQYGVWEQQLKSLDTTLIPISSGNSAKVISVTESAELLNLANGKLRDSLVLPPLQPPHDKRENISLTSTANSVLDILNPDGPPVTGENGGSPPPATPSMPTIAPPSQGGSSSPGSSSPQGPGGGSSSESNTGAAITMPVEQYDYDLKASGTYPALMDLLNELVIRKKLIRINKVVISKSAASAAAQPDAKDYPDYPLKLDMVVSLSIFLYESNAPATP